MTPVLHVVAAGNTLAPALAELVRLGYSVARVVGPAAYESFRAEKTGIVLKKSDWNFPDSRCWPNGAVTDGLRQTDPLQHIAVDRPEAACRGFKLVSSGHR